MTDDKSRALAGAVNPVNQSPGMNEREGLLRELRRHQRDYPSLIHGPLCGQAADEIERLAAPAPSAPQPGGAVAGTEQGTLAPPDVELERLRAVAWAAQGMLNADTYVSSIPREQAVREADLKLRQALGTWQMHHTAAMSAASALSRPQHSPTEKTQGSQ